MIREEKEKMSTEKDTPEEFNDFTQCLIRERYNKKSKGDFKEIFDRCLTEAKLALIYGNFYRALPINFSSLNQMKFKKN